MPAKLHRVAALLVLAVLAATPLVAQLAPPSTGGVVALDYLLQRLAENRRVLVIAAHPDDEDTSLLTLMARGYGAQAAYLALSRGEGGQNLIGEELGIGLGLLRSRELEAARQVDGATQFFTRSYDFGYSRSLDETSRFWPPDSLLKDAVRVVRRFRPHVIVTVFSGTNRDGHGQHQAAGSVTRPAFERAGDSALFPELLAEEGLQPWTPLKLYRSTRFDAGATTVELPTGVLDPRTGRTLHQIAMESRSQHSSQDMGRILPIGPAATRLMLLQDRTGFNEVTEEEHIFDGIPRDTSWLVQLADSLRGELSPAHIEDVVPALARALSRVASEAAPDDYRAELLREALAVAAGLVIDGRSSSETLVAGQESAVTVQFYNAGPYEVTLNDISLITPAGWSVNVRGQLGVTVSPGDQHETELTVTTSPDAEPSQPYFLERPLLGAQYDWSATTPEVRGRPFEPPVVRAVIEASVLGESLMLEREVTYRYADQATGEIRRALRVVPAIDVKLNPALVVWPAEGARERTFTISLACNGADPVAGTVRLDASGWQMPRAERFQFEQSGESRTIRFRVTRPLGVDEAEVSVRAIVETDDGRVFDNGIELIEYPHIRSVSRVVSAVSEVRIIPVRAPNLRAIGYVRGAADRVPNALSQIGLPIEILDAESLARANLATFDAIIVGSRAYEIDSALVRQNERLLDYVSDGGLLLVQYQQYQFARGQYAPFPLDISRPHDRVTDETAAVTVLQPEHAAFNSPNEIDETDWDEWPQERGLYFAGTWDDAYVPLLEMQDPGRDPVRGALLVADYGEGKYVYTGISFFRSLPIGTPGAYKLFLNLLGLNQRSVP